MPNIETCLNCLNDIDEQTLYAEGMVLSSHIMWSDKVSMVLEALQSSADTEDCEEFIQEAKSVGTGITVSKGDSLLKRVWDFIRRLVRSIINKISDVLTKLKIRNYEYVEIPMDKSLVEKDLDTINSIYTDLAMDILGTLIDSMSSDNDTKYDTDKVNKLIQRVSTLNILKGIDDGKRHGVKPNEFMTLRDKIRYIDKSSKELLKRTETILKDIERKSSEKNPANPKETEFMKKVQKLATDVSNATTKLFASFKFGSINKTRKMDKEIDVKIKNLKKHVDELSDLINDDKKKNVNESYYDSEYISIEDLEYIDETEKPYEAYLKKHDYDPKTNTIKIDGERRNAGKIPSKKERNRINKFLRENKYDPKTETYESDIKNKDDKPERIKLNIVPNTKEYENSHNVARYARTGEVAWENINLKQATLKGKPVKSNQTLKHEEGHANQERGHDSGHGNDINYHIWANPLSKETQNHHYNKDELDADMYGYQHNRYANKDKPNKTGLERRYKDSTDKSFDTAIKRSEEKYEKTKDYKMKDIRDTVIETAIYTLTETIKMKEHKIELILEDIEDLSEELVNESNVDKKRELTDEIKLTEKLKERTEKLLRELNEKLTRIKNGDYNLIADKFDVNTVQEDINNKIRDYVERATTHIDRLKQLRDDVKQETIYRNQFLDQHADEGGSQARKLEGRQGKHKGKK